MFAKKVHLLVWLGHCFDNPTTYLPYMEGKAMSTVKLISGSVANILQSPVG